MIKEFYGNVPFTSENTEPSMYIEEPMFLGGDVAYPEEIEDAIELMGEEAYIEEFIEDPELMGAFLKKWLRKRKRRLKKFKSRMKGMSKKEKRKFRRKTRRRRMKKITKGMFMRLLPGSKALAAIKLQRKLRGKKTNLLKQMGKRLKKIGRGRRGGRGKRRGMVQRIPTPISVPQIDDIMDVQPDLSPLGPLEPIYDEMPIAPVPTDQMIEDFEDVEAKQAGMGKMLPLVGVGLAALYFMTKKK